MLLPVARLVRRLRGDARSEEVASVVRRLSAAARDGGSDEAHAIARELRALRPQVLAAFDDVRSCTGCGRGRPEPHGHWAGGFCCGGATAGVFDDDEVAALALGGSKGRHVRAPSGDHAGCAFRGEQGCALHAEDRPNLCVRFACRELEMELRASGRWKDVRSLTRRLEMLFARFVAVHDAGRPHA